MERTDRRQVADCPVENILLRKQENSLMGDIRQVGGGAAVMHMVKGHYFMSIAIENANAAGSFLFMIRDIVNVIIR